MIRSEKKDTKKSFRKKGESGMRERIIENWLDSASERSYQPCFCQMLNARGHEVLHSTRHGPIEFGKDVIAKDPHGRLCAYQLKSNSNSRLTKSQLTNMQGQLVELASQPIRIPGLARVPDKSFLVTNGEVDEEAHLALDGINQTLRKLKAKDIELITRGTLLSWAVDLEKNLWPKELEGFSHLLNILVEDGRKIYPINDLHILLGNTLGILDASVNSMGSEELKRRISSCALLTSISLTGFDSHKNHYASIVAWTMFSVYSIAACEKFDVDYIKNAKNSVELAKTSIVNALGDLGAELQESPDFNLTVGNPLSDSFFYRARKLLMSALMSLYWFWIKIQKNDYNSHKKIITEFMPDTISNALWGEGAIPQYLPYIWYKRATGSASDSDLQLDSLLKSICLMQTKGKHLPLSSPYYDVEEAIKHVLRRLKMLSWEDDAISMEASGCSYFAEALMHLLVRAGMKDKCKTSWPDYSHLILRHFEPEQQWQYCLLKSPAGNNLIRPAPISKKWEELSKEAQDTCGEGIPDLLRKDYFLLMLWIIIVPYRATPSAVRFLDEKFSEI